MTAAEVRQLRPYLSYRYGPVGSDEVRHEVMALLGGQPVPEPLEETADKPASELEVSAGENVMLRRTGRILGTVRDVLFDGTELVGIVMKPRGFLTEDVVLQAGFLQRSDDAALFADLGEDDLEHLTPFKPAD